MTLSVVSVHAAIGCRACSARCSTRVSIRITKPIPRTSGADRAERYENSTASWRFEVASARGRGRAGARHLTHVAGDNPPTSGLSHPYAGVAVDARERPAG